MSNVRSNKCSQNNATKDLTCVYSNDYSEESVASSRDTAVQDQIKLSHCRLCAQDKDCDELFDLNIYDTETCKLYLSILDFFNIDFLKLSNYNIPKKTCESCYNTMLECYHFFHIVKKAQIILIELYGAKSNICDNLIKTEAGSESPIYDNTEETSGRKSRLSSLDSCTSKQSQSIDNQDNEYGPKLVDNAPTIAQDLKDKCDNVPLCRNTSEQEDNCDDAQEPEDIYDNLASSRNTSEPEDNRDNAQELENYYDNVPSGRNTSEPDDNSDNAQEPEDNCDKVPSSKNTPEPDEYCHDTSSSSSTPSESDDHCENISISSKSSAADYFPMKYCGFPIFYDTVTDVIQNYSNDGDESWNTYPWYCMHCQVECDSMKDLRLHSVQLHKKCYAFKCDDCDSLIFYTFNTFIEHVRQHRDALRYYCPHCNEQFESVSDCSNHILSHWSEGQRICDWCGEIFPDVNALKLHKSDSQPMRQSKKLKSLKPRIVAPVRMYNGLPVFENESNVETDFKTWDDYQWTCRECLLNLPSVQLLRIHTQEMHIKCFAMKCVDCPLLLRTFNQFVVHVTGHRPQLKNYCPYCNKNLKPENFKKHVDGHLQESIKSCYECGQVFENKQLAYQHYEKFQPLRRNLTTEDLTCDICGSIFTKLPILRLHKTTHDKNRQKEHTCDTCGKQFYTKGNLKNHLTTHGNKNHICKVCNKGYFSAHHLRKHVRCHLKEENFICDYCSKGFRTKRQLRDHIERIHMRIAKRIKCQICNKSLSASSGLKIHMRSTHTGERPYKCQNCDKTFTNWGNCNKHMVRIHKTTLSNTKLTEHGRIPIEKIANVTNMNADTQQWMHEVAKRTHTHNKQRSKKV